MKGQRCSDFVLGTSTVMCSKYMALPRGVMEARANRDTAGLTYNDVLA